MKFLFTFCLSALLSFSLFAGNSEAIAYNDKIVNEQTKIGEAILAFSSNPNEFSLSQIKTQAEESLEVLNEMKAFEGNKEFLNSAKELFKFYISISKNEYKQILELAATSSKYTQEELTEKINKLSNSLGKKEKPLDDRFQAAQLAFSKKYNFSLSKNELEDKIKEYKEQE